jgi:cathepsin A (carboxypeptidase C)
MFYWLFNSRRSPSTDPLVMWLTGGPGCSSEMAVFYENGPFTINDDMSLKSNAYSWNDVSNVIFVDNPVGTGFSESAGVDHLDKTEEEIAETMYRFIQGFLVANPEYVGRDFYVSGESYAGHYIPAIAYYLVNNATDMQIKFKGIAIGNGWVDPFN